MEPNCNGYRISPVDVDAISGATPKGQTHTIVWEIPENYYRKRVTLCIEANVSFDYNAYYTKSEGDPGYSDVNGQPSLVWAASFDAGDEPGEATPEIVGHGHVLGVDHAVDPDIGHITTAANLFNYLLVEYIPGG